MKLAFIILAHNDPENLFRLINRVSVDGDLVVVHWDKKNPMDLESEARSRLSEPVQKNLVFAKRVDVGWGDWSMVEATLSGLESVRHTGIKVDYVLLLSGADYPLRSIAQLKIFLERNRGKEFIECVDPMVDKWVQGGLVKERYQHFHPFNHRGSPTLFSWSTRLQSIFGFRRKIPDRLKIHFGAQWWALSGKTALTILDMSKQRRIRSFFKWVWIPDEMFFQTLVYAIVPDKIVSSGLTFYHFTEWGRPLVFYNDHLPFLKRQQYFFARKISPSAARLRDGLDAAIDAGESGAPVTVLKKNVHDYQRHIAINKQSGLSNRRIVGGQKDGWYGDLEWNRQPYFVVMIYRGFDYRSLQEALNARLGVKCYGRLFDRDRIDYHLPGGEHPFYPADKVALRDMKKTNFLSDIIHFHPDYMTGFFLDLDEVANDIHEPVFWDPRAMLVIVDIIDNHGIETSVLDWDREFRGNRVEICRDAARRQNKHIHFIRVGTAGGLLPDQVDGLHSRIESHLTGAD